jgi:hypothetical protein
LLQQPETRSKAGQQLEELQRETLTRELVFQGKLPVRELPILVVGRTQAALVFPEILLFQEQLRLEFVRRKVEFQAALQFPGPGLWQERRPALCQGAPAPSQFPGSSSQLVPGLALQKDSPPLHQARLRLLELTPGHMQKRLQ